MVACAAVVALAAGGSGVFGGLSGIFGGDGESLQVATTDRADRGIVAAPTAAERAGVMRALRGRSLERLDEERRDATPRSRRSPEDGSPPALTVPPQGGAVPPPTGDSPTPPAPPSAPAPGGGQVVTLVGETVNEVTARLPAETQPLIQPVTTAVTTLVETCRSLPICP